MLYYKTQRTIFYCKEYSLILLYLFLLEFDVGHNRRMLCDKTQPTIFYCKEYSLILCCCFLLEFLVGHGRRMLCYKTQWTIFYGKEYSFILLLLFLLEFDVGHGCRMLCYKTQQTVFSLMASLYDTYHLLGSALLRKRCQSGKFRLQKFQKKIVHSRFKLANRWSFVLAAMKRTEFKK